MGDRDEFEARAERPYDVPTVKFGDRDSAKYQQVPAPSTKFGRLICVAGVDMGRVFGITGDTMVIGRGPVDLQLSASDVSRHHARVSVDNNQFCIEDLGSSNGTFLNGGQVWRKMALQVGDRIQIGSTILVFGHQDDLEDRMREIKQLETMSDFACGLAHDFNNALTIIAANLSVVEEELESRADLRSIVGQTIEAACDAAKLARQLLKLGRPDPRAFELVRMDSLVDRAIAMFRRSLTTPLAIETLVPGVEVLGNSAELRQVLLNLFLNARDAMPTGGTLSVMGQVVHFDQPRALSRQLPSEGAYLQLSVADTGVGMDEATLARAFEPFFTTKPVGKGTGLGLAMIHKLVRGHGGDVTVRSVQHRGTTFRILLPISAPVQAAP